MTSLIFNTFANVESIFNVNKCLFLLLIGVLIFTRFLDVVFSKMDIKKDTVYIYETSSLALLSIAVFYSRDIAMRGGSLINLIIALGFTIIITPIVILVSAIKKAKSEEDVINEVEESKEVDGTEEIDETVEEDTEEVVKDEDIENADTKESVKEDTHEVSEHE